MSARRGERGAILVEYALVLSLLLIGSIGVIQLLDTATRDEVDTQADCISTRPPPPSCQPRPVTTTTTIGGPATSNPTTTTTPVNATLTWQASAVIDHGDGRWDALTFPEILLPDDGTGSGPQPVAGATVRVEVFIVEPPPILGPFFISCVTDATGRCELRFTTPAPGVTRLEYRNPTVTGYAGPMNPITQPVIFFGP